jgi:hypothetical protein
MVTNEEKLADEIIRLNKIFYILEEKCGCPRFLKGAFISCFLNTQREEWFFDNYFVYNYKKNTVVRYLNLGFEKANVCEAINVLLKKLPRHKEIVYTL